MQHDHYFRRQAGAHICWPLASARGWESLVRIFLSSVDGLKPVARNICVLVFIGSGFSLQAQSLKSVMTLDFINIEKKENFTYLEGSLTEAVREKLKQNFAFREVTSEIYMPVAETNYIYRKDFYTETAATNLGLLAKGDIVIAGGFRVVETKTKTEIRISVLLIDTAKKKTIAEFSEKTPVDSTLFVTVEKIATRITTEAAKVLPSKEEFRRKGITTRERPPIFGDFSFSLRTGVTIYYGGLGNFFKPEQPAFSLNVATSLPFLWKRLSVQTEATLMRHSLKEGNETVVQAMQLSGITTNYVLLGYLGILLPIGQRWTVIPKAGAGYIIQTTQVTGLQSGNFNNGFLTFAGGADVLFSINRNLDLSAGLVSIFELERNIITTAFQGLGGIRFRF